MTRRLTCPRPDRTCPHHRANASTQASLVSRDPNSKSNAPLATIRMPNGTSFSAAGGSWSHPLATLPRRSVRVFPPTGVLTQPDLRLGVHRQFQGSAIGPGLVPSGRDVREDRVGLGRLLERL